MATQADIDSLQRKQNANADSALTLPKLPSLPEEVKKRFPTMRAWETDMEEWRRRAEIRIRGGQI